MITEANPQSVRRTFPSPKDIPHSDTPDVPSISEVSDSVAPYDREPQIIFDGPEDDEAYSDDFESEPEIAPTQTSQTDNSVVPVTRFSSKYASNGE